MNGLTPLRSQLLLAHGFRHGFSPRQGGVGLAPYDTCNLGRAVQDDPEHVAENRRRFAAAVGYDEARLYELSQVHGRTVRAVSPSADPLALRGEEGDGLVAAGGLAVGVRSADCVPVLVADPVTRTAAALHAGWRGTVAGVVAEGVRALCELSGAPAARLVGALFPHIRACCFEVSGEVAEALRSCSAAEDALHWPGPKPHVALSAILRAQLTAAGVPERQIDDVAGCTRCDAARFFSYRRDGAASGRHLTVIVAG